MKAKKILFVNINLMVALLATALSLEVKAEENRNDTCDCAIFPFKPQPPCVRVCGPKVAARVPPEKLVSILGLDSQLAAKIASLDELDIEMTPFVPIWQKASLDKKPVIRQNGELIGYLAGVYLEPASQQYQFVIDENLNNELGGYYRIPIAETVGVENGAIAAMTNATEFGTPTAWLQGRQRFDPVPDWSEEQLTEEELEELARKFEQLSEEDFIRLLE